MDMGRIKLFEITNINFLTSVISEAGRKSNLKFMNYCIFITDHHVYKRGVVIVANYI